MWSITYSYIRYFCFPIVLNARCSRPDVLCKKMFLKVSKNSEIEKFLKNTFFQRTSPGDASEMLPSDPTMQVAMIFKTTLQLSCK